MIHAVILAGGGGTRLWPLSTDSKPKQYLPLLGNESILMTTVKRVSGLVPADRVWIVTTEEQLDLVRKEELDVPESNIILEPAGRNTAPCIGLAAVKIRKVDPDATMLVLPADHLIKDVAAFLGCVEHAVAHVEDNGGLVTFGIKPTRPETGYGYIHSIAVDADTEIQPVIAFKEKPDSATAVSFVKSGDYYWNSGMFVWKAATILKEFATHLPKHAEVLDILADLDQEDPVFRDGYNGMEAISIDYGIMEHSEQVFMVPGEFDWSDVGGFEELQRISDKNNEGNHIEGNILLEGVTDSYITSNDSRPVAVIGLEGITVVVNEDGILISRTSESQKVREISKQVSGKKK